MNQPTPSNPGWTGSDNADLVGRSDRERRGAENRDVGHGGWRSYWMSVEGVRLDVLQWHLKNGDLGSGATASEGSEEIRYSDLEPV
jgi:hypothetical protein